MRTKLRLALAAAIASTAAVAHPSLPARSLQELIAYAKANPGKLDSRGSSAAGNCADWR